MSGATTGTCAAAAAKAARLHAAGRPVPGVLDVPLPGGGRCGVRLLAWGGHRRHPWASVRKPASDDPDATRGAVVVASLRPADALAFRAGPGVGIVTRPGLQVPPGEPAINPGPREQIRAALAEASDPDWLVTVSVQGGAAIASRTFNNRLGIEGGISILGTSGIVRPWSTEAFLASADAHLSVVRRAGDAVALVPGHMGSRAAVAYAPGLETVEVGNAWGDVLDLVARHGFRDIVALGHPGKLVKLAQGQWDTHSAKGSGATAWSARFLDRTRIVERRPGSVAGALPATMEELLGSLEADVAERAAHLLARSVARRIARRSGLPTRVVLVDLAGRRLGEAAS